MSKLRQHVHQCQNFLVRDFFVCPTWKVQLLILYASIKNIVTSSIVVLNLEYWQTPILISLILHVSHTCGVACDDMWRDACTHIRLDNKCIADVVEVLNIDLMNGLQTSAWFSMNSESGEFDNTFWINTRRYWNIHIHRRFNTSSSGSDFRTGQKAFKKIKFLNDIWLMYATPTFHVR